MGDDFVFDWTEKLGFRENPFHTDIPDRVTATYTGYNSVRKALNVFVLEQEQFGTITGAEGMGKTMTLHWVKEHVQSNALATAFDAAALETERDLIHELVTPVMNVFDTVRRVHASLQLEDVGQFLYRKLEDQPLLVLIDNVESLPNRYHRLFQYFFDKDLEVQLITAGVSQPTIAEDSLDISLTGLNDEALIELIRVRVEEYGREGIFPFEQDHLEELAAASDGCPGAFLETCRKEAIELALDDDYMAGKDRSGNTSGSSMISVHWGDTDESPQDTSSEEEQVDELEFDSDETSSDVKDDDDEEMNLEETEKMLSEMAEEFDK